MGQGNKTNTLDKIFYNNQEISEDNEKAKVCNEHFIAVGQKLAEDIPSTNESPTGNITPTKTKFKFGCITIAQIEKVIKRLINNKATGMNGIPNKILKDNLTYLSPSLRNFSIFPLKLIHFQMILKLEMLLLCLNLMTKRT